MTLISKLTGGLSLLSNIHDVHKTALISSRNEYAKVSSDTMISNSINNQKIDKISYKDAQRKNWLAQGNFLSGIKEMWAMGFGYIKGFAKSILRYIPNIVCATIAIFAGKNREKTANVSAAILGALEAFDFARNSLGIGQRKDYLE